MVPEPDGLKATLDLAEDSRDVGVGYTPQEVLIITFVDVPA